MTTTTATSLPKPPQSHPAPLSRAAWLWIVAIGLLFTSLHFHFLKRMFLIATGKWSGDWSHALIVPLISAYFVYQNRDRLLTTPRRVFLPGLLLMFLGMFSFAWWIHPGRNDMLQGYSMILALFGLVLFLLGPRMMGVLWFPIAYLVFAVKVSDRIWDRVAWKLQLIAAKSSTMVLQMVSVFTDFEVKNTGSTIDLSFMSQGQWVTEQLNVAEACSGLRMLMAFLALGVAMAYLANRRWWQRLIMVLAAVPVAILVNVGRVTVVGLLYLVDKDMATGDFHIFVGMLMLIPAALLFLLLGWILDQLIIYDRDAEGAPYRAGERRAGKQETEPLLSTLQCSAVLMSHGHLIPAAKGAAVGALLTGLIGLNYWLLLGVFKPEQISENLSRAGALGLWIGGLLLLLLGCGLLWRVLRGDRKVNASRDVPVAVLQTRPSAFSAAATQQITALGVGASVLATALLGFSVVRGVNNVVLIKEPLPLRKELFEIPNRVAAWEKISDDPPLPAAQLEALGTHQYISRHYRDTSMPQGSPGSELRLHVAYYTGTPDTVPHVPDRCYVAGGANAINTSVATLHFQGPLYQPLEAGAGGSAVVPSRLNSQGVFIPHTAPDATIFTYSPPNAPQYRSNVIYFFVANNKFLRSPDQVRFQSFDPTDRYSYYCKVEVLVLGVADPRQATRRASEFLSDLLPEIMACLPDWREVNQRRVNKQFTAAPQGRFHQPRHQEALHGCPNGAIFTPAVLFQRSPALVPSPRSASSWPAA